MRLIRLIAVISISTLFLVGCATPQASFDKAFELANQSFQSGDFVMAKAHIDDALKALPDSAAGKELQQRIVYSTFSQETLLATRAAASRGDWQDAMNLAWKLDSNHPDELEANRVATEAINEFLTSFSTSPKITDATELQNGLTEILEMSDARELDVNQLLFSKAVAVLGDFQAESLQKLLAQREYDGALELALSLEFSELYTSSSSIRKAISKAKSGFEANVLVESRKLTNANKFDEAGKFVRLAQTKLPGSESLSSELSRVVKLSQQEQERQAKEAQKARERAVSAMLSKKDSFEDVEWIYDRATYSQYAGNKFLLYMGRRDQGTPWLRLRFMMYDDTWHFFESIKLDVDGVRYSYFPGFSEVDRDNGGGDIWEWYDLAPTAADIRMVEAIIKSKSTRIRYINADNFYVERTVSSAQKKALARVLLAYEVLGGIRP
jgi:hypothetical protein